MWYSHLRVIVSWTWSLFHCLHTSPPCHVAKVDTFILLCRAHLRLRKRKSEGENRWTDREKRWWVNEWGFDQGERIRKRKMIGGGTEWDSMRINGWTKKKKIELTRSHLSGFSYSQGSWSWGWMKGEVRPNASACQGSGGDPQSFLISLSFTACCLCLRPFR